MFVLFIETQIGIRHLGRKVVTSTEALLGSSVHFVRGLFVRTFPASLRFDVEHYKCHMHVDKYPIALGEISCVTVLFKMVTLSDVQASNAQIPTALPSGLVAVFVGATNGIGESTLMEFARHARQARVYLVGRSQDAGDRISAECRQLNPGGEFTFIKADLSLMRNVDDVCREIESKENVINLLFLSCGVSMMGVGSSLRPIAEF